MRRIPFSVASLVVTTVVHIFGAICNGYGAICTGKVVFLLMVSAITKYHGLEVLADCRGAGMCAEASMPHACRPNISARTYSAAKKEAQDFVHLWS